MIHGQSTGETAKIRYGLFPMSFNGCEVISVFNALEYLGKQKPLGEVVKYMRRFAVLFGLFGCNVYSIGKALKHFGVESRRCDINSAGDTFILSSWTGTPFLSSIHTVFCVRENGRIKVYNRFNSCTCERFYDSPEKIFENCRVIAIYELRIMN